MVRLGEVLFGHYRKPIEFSFSSHIWERVEGAVSNYNLSVDRYKPLGRQIEKPDHISDMLEGLLLEEYMELRVIPSNEHVELVEKPEFKVMIRTTPLKPEEKNLFGFGTTHFYVEKRSPEGAKINKIFERSAA